MPQHTPKDCPCTCHDGAQIICSCFAPCCTHPRGVRDAEYPEPPPVPPVKFTKLVLPIIRRPFPKLP